MNSPFSPGRPQRLEQPHQLLVEGNTTREFVTRALRVLNIESVEVHDFGGVDELAEFTKLFSKRPDFSLVKRIGVIRDAEGSVQDAVRAIRSAFARAGFGELPTRPGQFKRLGRKGQARFEGGYFVLAGSHGHGMLESLCLEAVDDRRILDCVESFVQCAGKQIHKRATDKHRCLSYLAIMHPDLRVPSALEVRWKVDHPVFRPFVAFLRGLSSSVMAASS